MPQSLIFCFLFFISLFFVHLHTWLCHIHIGFCISNIFVYHVSAFVYYIYIHMAKSMWMLDRDPQMWASSIAPFYLFYFILPQSYGHMIVYNDFCIFSFTRTKGHSSNHLTMPLCTKQVPWVQSFQGWFGSIQVACTKPWPLPYWTPLALNWIADCLPSWVLP